MVYIKQVFSPALFIFLTLVFSLSLLIAVSILSANVAILSAIAMILSALCTLAPSRFLTCTDLIFVPVPGWNMFFKGSNYFRKISSQGNQFWGGPN